MKSVRMFSTGALVIAIVGTSLAGTKHNPNLFKCDIGGTGICKAAWASSFDPGGAPQLSPTDFYTSNTATTDIDCFKSGSTTQGCSSSNHPAQAFLND